VDRLREERNLYEAGDDPQVPVEFAAAAYRYGHSQIRERYRLNRDMAPTKLFPDLVGLRAVPPALEADWELLFDLPGRPPALPRARRIDGRLVTSLIRPGWGTSRSTPSRSPWPARAGSGGRPSGTTSSRRPEVLEEGRRLGPVGGRSSPRCSRASSTRIRAPSAPSSRGGRRPCPGTDGAFGLGDLLAFATGARAAAEG
jgi:hypothetical protein